jgi:sarcosine oxidase subunit alpha
MRLSKGVRRGREIEIVINSQPVTCFEGETVAAVMLEQGLTTYRRDSAGRPRGLFCNMGACMECLVQVGERRQRACLTDVSPAMQITTGEPR